MKLSVVTTCYNSADYIEKTVNAVLGQEVDFEFEYIISDDGSHDNTVEILECISAKHPKGDFIKLISHKKNIGVVRNFFGAIFSCSGKFIAFCDSDDIWQDKNKLRKQMLYMTSNEQCVLTYHHLVNVPDTALKNEDEQRVENLNQPLLHPQTSTLMIRNVVGSVPEDLLHRMSRMNDQLLRFILSSKGEFCSLRNIEPTRRVIRMESVFGSPRSELSRRRSSLRNWQHIYEAYKDTDQREFLEKKISGFQSAVYWLEYKEARSLSLLKRSLRYDLQNRIMIRKGISKMRRLLFKPLISIRDLSNYLRSD